MTIRNPTRPGVHWIRRLHAHRYGMTLVAYLAAATLTGGACILFMRGFEAVLALRPDFANGGPATWLAAPFLFVVAVTLVRRLAPAAAGTGIPQAVFAAAHLRPGTERRLKPLMAVRTVAVKVVSLLTGLLGGASTGREGPTVHVAAGVFYAVMRFFRKFAGVSFDASSAVVAGGAAGLAAAFNTPLAGVTFAVEELVADRFHAIKDYVLIAIVVAGLAAKSLTGEYAYFGRLADPAPLPLSTVLLVGLVAGWLGVVFARLLIWGTRRSRTIRPGARRWLWPAGLALAVLAVTRLAPADVSGPGNRAAQSLLAGEGGTWVYGFPAAKMAATLLTYWSGIAGGIFAPCLAIGAAVGEILARLRDGPGGACAMVGMAAFLCGAIHAPITAFVIIFEMTGRHAMLLPVMLGSLTAFVTARLVDGPHLYKVLAEGYRPLLGRSGGGTG